jgi:hypothetical protein
MLAVVLTGLWCGGCSPSAAPSQTTDASAAAHAEPTRPTAAAATAGAAAPKATGEFVPLTLADFDRFPADADGWSAADGLLRTTGQPKGYIYSKQSYRNFTWRGEYRFLPAAEEADQVQLAQSNTGFMLCIEPPHKTWPRSLEVQGKHVEMAQIKSNGGVAALTITDDPTARESARKPVGEWNQLEIVVRDGAVTATLNGREVCRSAPGELTSGAIGLQAESFPVEFRGLAIREE